MAQQNNASSDAFGGITLIGATILALIFANTALATAYNDFLAIPVNVTVGNFEIAKPLVLWINDGLMAVFFLMVGLEIKYEFVEGNLSTKDKAILPAVGAIGGMAVPALIYVGINLDSPETIRGWAIPAATDIAFALGILGLMASRVPTALKAFLLALAVLDDLGAIIIIAAFYTENLSIQSLILSAIFIAILAAMNFGGVRKTAPYILVGLALWVCVLKSGVHATLAGVITALFIPLKGEKPDHSPLHSMVEDLRYPVLFGIMPIFAFANAGVPFAGMSLADLQNPVTLGIIAGLFIGKPLGILACVAFATSTGLAKLPDSMTKIHIVAAGAIAGIGFTMSLFIGTLAFTDPSLTNSVRLGVLCGSSLSIILGVILLFIAGPKKEEAPLKPHHGIVAE